MRPRDSAPKLSDLGISKTQSSRCNGHWVGSQSAGSAPTLCLTCRARRPEGYPNRCRSWLGTERTDPQRFCRLLRARHKWPHCRAAKQRDELAPFQLTKLHPLPLAKVTAYRIGGDQVSGLLRCGSSVHLTTAVGHVWTAPAVQGKRI